MTPISAVSALGRAPGVVDAATPPSSSRSKRPRIDGPYTPACKSSGGSRPPKPSGYAPVSRPERPSSATADNGFSALRGSQVSFTSATSPAPIAPPPDTPPSAGQIPCSPMSKTASWPPTAPSRPNICRATSAPSPGASTAASSSKQFTSGWPSLPRRPRQCPIASSNWLRLDGKREPDYHVDSRTRRAREADRPSRCELAGLVRQVHRPRAGRQGATVYLSAFQLLVQDVFRRSRFQALPPQSSLCIVLSRFTGGRQHGDHLFGERQRRRVKDFL